MSGGSSQSTQQLDPAMRDAFLGNVTRATGVAEGLQPRQFADFNADQQRSFDVTRQFADPNSEAFRGTRQAFALPAKRLPSVLNRLHLVTLMLLNHKPHNWIVVLCVM